MKSKFTCLFLLFAAPLLHGQATPTLMSYQGRVTDAAGVLIGNTAPVNRTVTFKLYTEPSGGAPIYAETQSVTISGGEFSVLIGNGAAVSGIPGPGTRSLDATINSVTYTNLYLGITVDDGTAAVDPEISPRQQMVSGAFALRAKVAESVAGGAVTTTMLGDAQVTTGKIAAGAVDGSRIANNTIVANNIANSTITAGKLDANSIGIWTPTGSSVYRATGNVGIGETNPNVPLNFKSEGGNKISLWGNSATAHYGFGIQSALLQIYSAGSTSDIAFGYGSSVPFTERMRVKGNGNVGIGTSTPAEKLVVAGTAQADRLYSNGVVRARGGNYGANSTNTGFSFDGNGDSTGGMFSGAAGTLQFYTNGTEKMRIDATGNVGMGTTSPYDRLDVAGGVRVNALHAQSSRTTHAQGAHLEWNKFSSTGATYLLNQKGAGPGGFVFGEVTTADSVTERMRIDGDGRIRMNTSETLGFLNVGHVTASYYRYGALDTDGGHSSNGQENNVALSIYTTGRIFTPRVDITSDERIKTNLQRSDSANDLVSLMQIEVTNYDYLDTLHFGPGQEKKVIAQQVEKVIPQAVTRQRGVVPDIYRMADVDQGWVTVPGTFEVGERLRVIASDEAERTLEILATRDGAVLLDLEPELREVFVYGREVDDLRSVDYDALAMLNVSATQELYHRVVRLEAESKTKKDLILSLEDRLKVVEGNLGIEKLDQSKDQKTAELEARFAALEKLIQSGN